MTAFGPVRARGVRVVLDVNARAHGTCFGVSACCVSRRLAHPLAVAASVNRGIYSTVEPRDFEQIVRERLAETGDTPIGAARRAGLPRDAIRSVLRGHPPSLVRAKKICEALGLSLNVGPLQSAEQEGAVDAGTGGGRGPDLASALEHHTQGLVRAVAAAGGDPIPPEMRPTVQPGPVAPYDLRTAEAASVSEAGGGTVVIPFAAEVRLSAGSGQPVWDETEEMSVSVARSALASWAGPERLRCARVVGDSMAPTLGDGDLVVLDSGAYRAARRSGVRRAYRGRAGDQAPPTRRPPLASGERQPRVRVEACQA